MKFTSLLFSVFVLTSLVLSQLIFSSVVLASQSISVSHYYSRATPPNAVNSAIFANITNNSEQERTLVSVSSLIAEKLELHDVIHEGDIMKMRQVKQIIIPAGQTVQLKPGSLHIMLLGLKNQLKKGQEIKVTLSFANGDKQTLIVPVKKVMAGMHMSHH